MELFTSGSGGMKRETFGLTSLLVNDDRLQSPWVDHNHTPFQHRPTHNSFICAKRRDFFVESVVSRDCHQLSSQPRKARYKFRNTMNTEKVVMQTLLILKSFQRWCAIHRVRQAGTRDATRYNQMLEKENKDCSSLIKCSARRLQMLESARG